MEVEDCYSAKSECYGAFERRRETSTMEEFKGGLKAMMDEQLWEIKAMMAGMLMSQNQSTTGGIEKKEKAAVIIQAFLRTTLVRVRLGVRLERRDWYYSIMARVRFGTFDLGPWWKDYRGRQEEKARARAAAKARKRAKAKRRERAKKIAGNEILGGGANTDGVRMMSGDEDDSSVPLKGRDAFTSIRGVERSLGGAINGIAICGAGVFAGRKCEFCASDGTFCEANVGGDDEKYEENSSIAEYSKVACGRTFGAGMCLANMNVERVFLYFHYEYVKCEFG